MDGEKPVQGEQATQEPAPVAQAQASTPPTTPAPDPVADLRKQVESLTKSVSAFQSDKDKAIARAIKAERDAANAKAEADAARKRLDGVTNTLGRSEDPDVVRVVRDATQAEELAYLRSRVQQQEARQQVLEMAQEHDTRFKASLVAGFKELDVDPNDPELDWAADAPDAYTRQERVLKSAAKIHKRQLQQANAAARAQTAVAQANSDREVHNPDVVQGASSGRTFTREQIKDRAFWKANKPEIEKALAEGRIK